MATWRIILHPKSSVATWLSSDTLFGALCWAIQQLEGNNGLSQWLQKCQDESPQWLLSSAFPFVNGEAPVRFFPMPLTLMPTAEDVAKVGGAERCNRLKAISQAKRLSKIAYLSETLFAQALKGNLTPQTLLAQALREEVTAIGNCLLTSEEAEQLQRTKTSRLLWASVDVQHTAVDRVCLAAAEGLLFFDTEQFFAPRVGLFFLLCCPEDFPFQAALRLLEHGGFGGNRSVGKGWFDITSEPADAWLEQLQPKDANAVVLLSQCIPQAGEFDWRKSVYRLITKRPKFESAYGQPQRVYKGILRVVAEGSVLVPREFKPTYGRLIKVGDATDWNGSAHPVFHNGLGFPLRMVVPDALA